MEMYVVAIRLFGLMLVIVAVLLYWINDDQRKMTEVEHLVSREDEPFFVEKRNPLYQRLNIFATLVALIGIALLICSVL